MGMDIEIDIAMDMNITMDTNIDTNMDITMMQTWTWTPCIACDIHCCCCGPEVLSPIKYRSGTYHFCFYVLYID